MTQKLSYDQNDETVAKGAALAVAAPVVGFASMTAAYALRNNANALWHRVPAGLGVAAAIGTVIGTVVCLNEMRNWAKSPPQAEMPVVQQWNAGMGDMTSVLGKALEADQGIDPKKSVYHPDRQGMIEVQNMAGKHC